MPRARLALAGRTRELEALESVLEQAAHGEPSLAFIEGETGIGKTRLLDAVGERVLERGGIVVRGVAPPPTGEPLPFAAVASLLRDVLRQVPEEARGALVHGAPELGHLQPAWRCDGGPTVPPTSLTGLCERVVDVVDGIAAGQPLTAVLLDDLQWADAATVDLMTYAARAPRDARVALIVAAQLDGVRADAPIQRMRTAFLRHGAVSLALKPLDEEHVERMLDELLPGGNQAKRRRITTLARGNPLFVSELADARTSSGGLPDTIVALVESRLASLTEEQRDLLRIVALDGEGVAAGHLLEIRRGPPEPTLADLRHLSEQRLLAVSEEEVAQVANPVVREVIVRGVLAPTRRIMHAAIARAIAAAPDVDTRPEVQRLVRLAEHWDKAGDRVRALPALARAAEAAERSFAFVTAFELYGRALDKVDTNSIDPARKDAHEIGFRAPSEPRAKPDPFLDLRRRAADAAVLAGEPAVALEWLDKALADTPPSAARDQLEVARARALLASGNSAQAAEAYAAMERRLGSLPSAAGAAFARALVGMGRSEEAIKVGQRALVAAREGRSKTDEASALVALGIALCASGSVEAGLGRLDEARAIRQGHGSPSIVRPRMSRVIELAGGLAQAARGVHAAGGSRADSVADDAARTAARFGAEAEGARLRLDAAVQAFHAGRWDEALGSLTPLTEHRSTRIGALAVRARIAALRGAWERADDDLASIEGPSLVRERPDDRASYGAASIEIAASRRELGAAMAAAATALVMGGDASADARAELLAITTRVHVEGALAARVLRAADEEVERRAVAGALAAEGERIATPGARAQAWVTAARAEVARLDHGAEPAWQAAVDGFAGAGLRWWEAYALLRQAEALLTASGSRDAAREILSRAREIAEDLQAGPLLTEISSLATRARLQLAAPPPLAPAPSRKLPISERELEVLVLLARGRTNREIAAELFISERTAAHHVAHLFDKLGVSSRVEAAGVAHRAGLVEASPAE